MSKLADPTLKRLLRQYSLQKIEVTITEGGVFMRAIPDSFHPLVTSRREEGHAAADTGDGISLTRAREINEASTAPVANVRGDTVEAALAALAPALGQKVRG